MTVLFVCTGNTCRSPMAEALMENAAARRGLDITPLSAGLSASEGSPISHNARKALKKRGLLPPDGPERRAKPVNEPLIDGADLILTMTTHHRDALSTLFPASLGKTYTLGEYAGDFADVPDPFGQNLTAYEMCLADLERKVDAVIDKLTIQRFCERDTPAKPVALGCDHGGFRLKTAVIKYLQSEKIAFTDFGAFDDNPSDYPEYAKKVIGAVKSGECAKGMLFCGTGIGVSIAANRHAGVRAALCHDTYSAEAARAHNDANILAMGGRVIGEGPAAGIVKVFLETPFSGEERHMKRLDMLEAGEGT